MDMTHLNALKVRLSHERDRLSRAITENERKLRQVWVSQLEKEIAQEYLHLGITPPENVNEKPMSDEDLLRELGL